MTNVFITGESGTIPKAMQEKSILKKYDINVLNNSEVDALQINHLKRHQSFQVRKPEIDFTDRELLFSKDMTRVWEQTDVIIHSGAFVGTDFCDANPNEAIRVNVEGTKNIVDICNSFNIKLIYFSTTAIFDTNAYDKHNLITEQTKIRPQTLYGITKYTGEQIVERLCKTPKTIVRPVFGFGDYPDDLHSALTKYIYMTYKGLVDAGHDKTLDILLNPNITKSYTRVENIAHMVYKIITLDEWDNIFNIGEPGNKAVNWNKLSLLTCDAFGKLNIKVGHFDKSITFRPIEDYLHFHNISTQKIETYGILDSHFLSKHHISLEDGIAKTVKSVINNFHQTPYWI